MAKKHQFRLWTPIANAFEAYRRRLIAEPKATFEHTWRLLHIEESLIVTLGSALASRLRDRWSKDSDKHNELNHLRRMITGLSSGDEVDTLTEQNCLTGSIDAWINVLQRYGKSEIDSDCPFCDALGKYLTEDISERIEFVDVWGRISPVPEVHKKETHSRIERIRAINTFRNKIAHVPIPHKVMGDIHRGLRIETIRLFSPDEQLLKTSAHIDLSTRKFHAVLCGALVSSNGFVTGSEVEQLLEASEISDSQCWFRWTAIDSTDDSERLNWDATPFVRLDEELKVALLFRVNGLVSDPELDEFQGDYHRFAAEIEPVRQESVGNDLLRPWFPAEREHVEQLSAEKTAEVLPSKEDSEPIASLPTEELLGRVDDSIHNGNYSSIQEVLGEVFKRDGSSISTEKLREWVDISLRDRAFSTSIKLFDELLQRADSPLSSEKLRDWSEISFRARSYPTALKMFDELSKRGDTFKYNDVARGKHGVAMWQVAESDRDGPQDNREKIKMLVDAIQLLEEAAKHVDPIYSAKALYQQSKALWHLWKYQQTPDVLEQARSCAQRAVMMVYESTYVSWYDRLERESQGIKQEA